MYIVRPTCQLARPSLFPGEGSTVQNYVVQIGLCDDDFRDVTSPAVSSLRGVTPSLRVDRLHTCVPILAPTRAPTVAKRVTTFQRKNEAWLACLLAEQTKRSNLAFLARGATGDLIDRRKGKSVMGEFAEWIV